MSDMTSNNPRATEFAERFEAAQEELIRLVGSLDDEQWDRVGKNFPQRTNDEDESRSVAVIAHHVAASGPFIMERIHLMLAGKPMPSVGDFRQRNASHAADNAGVTRDEVLKLLRETEGQIAADVRAIPDDQLDMERPTPAGPMSVAMRLDRVLIGHIHVHLGSIKAALEQ